MAQHVVYGLTADGIRDVREIKRRVLNAPINQRPKQRRWPVSGGGDSTATCRIEPDSMVIVRGMSAPAARLSADGEVTASLTLRFDYALSGVFFGGEVVEARRVGNRWQCVSKGHNFLIGTADENMTGAQLGGATVPFGGDLGDQQILAENEGFYTTRLFRPCDNVSAGSPVFLHWVQGSREFVIEPACRAPITEDME